MKNILDNNTCPFTVPDGYFDTLQERIMNRIQIEENEKRSRHSSFFTLHSSFFTFRTLVAAAACLLFIFTGATLYMRYSDKQPIIAESLLDEDFYRWFYASDEATLFAESLDIDMPDDYMFYETDYSEEEEAIIRFLERDNINVAAILHSFDNETFLFP
jgi:ABC-type long-subunit fatty acid transport system fused permease/ATPase subunit